MLVNMPAESCLTDLHPMGDQDPQAGAAGLPPYRRISASAAAAQATGLAPTRPVPPPARRRVAPAAPRAALGAAAKPQTVTSGFGAMTPVPPVVSARGSTWLQAARSQAARLAVRGHGSKHDPIYNPNPDRDPNLTLTLRLFTCLASATDPRTSPSLYQSSSQPLPCWILSGADTKDPPIQCLPTVSESYTVFRRERGRRTHRLP